jgi:hypothetical protein
VANSRERVVLELMASGGGGGKRPVTVKDQLVKKCCTRPRTWTDFWEGLRNGKLT